LAVVENNRQYQKSNFSGHTRTEATASEKEIAENIDNILIQWKGFLKEETENALRNLKEHAKCMANIPGK
jgi:hypothetical protein